jgi:hypothetical protein
MDAEYVVKTGLEKMKRFFWKESYQSRRIFRP